MHIDLTGRTALVTGSTAGIGFAIAGGLADAGAAVIVNGRTSERVDHAVATLKESATDDVRVSGAIGDVGTEEGIASIVEQVPSVDILINNAATFFFGTYAETPREEWRHSFEVNVFGAADLTRHYLPAMVEAGWGRVIFVSSESGVVPPTELLCYGVTKTALLALARGVAASVPGTGVTVNSVLPGPTTSEAFVEMLEGDVAAGRAENLEQAGEAYIDEFRNTSLLRRPATPAEVANMVVYLVSNQASATLGAAVRVDGGVVPTAF